MEWHVFVMNQA